MGAPESYLSGTVPQTTDSERMLLVKLIIAEGGGSGGTGSAKQEVFPGHYGAVPPVFVPASNHALAPDLDPPNVLWAWNPDLQQWE